MIGVMVIPLALRFGSTDILPSLVLSILPSFSNARTYEGSKLLCLDEFVYSVLADWHALAYLEWTHYFREVYKHSFKLFNFFFSCHGSYILFIFIRQTSMDAPTFLFDLFKRLCYTDCTWG